MATHKVEVTVRTNQGENQIYPASDVAEAISIANKQRTPDSYMVCIVQDGVRTRRWDRARIVGENKWRQEDPDAFELLGAIRSVSVAPPRPPQDLLGDANHPAGLRCYQVGDSDWFAATSPEEALALMREVVGDDMWDPEDYEAELSSKELLDKRWVEEDEPGKDAGSLREWLAAATEPGWLGGTEP